MKTVTKKGLIRACLMFALFVIFLAAGLIVLGKVVPSGARRALPDSASDIQEYHSGGHFTGDGTRVLKARLPEKDFPQYAKNLGLADKYDPNKHGSTYASFLSMGVGGMPDWWDAPDELENCYFSHTPGEDGLVLIKWKNGRVYFLAVSW